MRLQIHDVGHGLCISLIHENGNVMLWDCGHAEWGRPSAFLPNLGIRTVQRFFVTNFDQDHISDLVQLRAAVNIELLHCNDTITSQQLRALKAQSGPISAAMESMLQMIDGYCGGPPATPPRFPNVEFTCYRNAYGVHFNDTNNISLVTFLQFGNIRFVIPGDLEVEGWRKLLQNQNFVADLSGVHVFIASHHGRENGYCPEVFEHCSPNVVVFSDSPAVHATQQMASTYGRHASGIQFNGTPRSVLSTRSDGSIWWDQ